MRILLDDERHLFHQHLLAELLVKDKKGVPSNADKDSRISCDLASGILEGLGGGKVGVRLAGQTAGQKFEKITLSFVRRTFPYFAHLNPGPWSIEQIAGRAGTTEIAKFEQYQHLRDVEAAIKNSWQLSVAFGAEYVITPDIVVGRGTASDEQINERASLVSGKTATHAFIREGRLPTLHASISCKWTIRSDRSQNARSEGLNLTRNRKGRTPHIVVVTGEPSPSRIKSVAIGTGDIDCVYHFALPELEAAAQAADSGAFDEVCMLVEGKRLKDISDLPLDLLL
jgi:hypothetical protein